MISHKFKFSNRWFRKVAPVVLCVILAKHQANLLINYTPKISLTLILIEYALLLGLIFLKNIKWVLYVLIALVPFGGLLHFTSATMRTILPLLGIILTGVWLSQIALGYKKIYWIKDFKYLVGYSSVVIITSFLHRGPDTLSILFSILEMVFLSFMIVQLIRKTDDIIMVHKIAFISITILALLTILNASGIIYLGGDAKALDYGDFYRYGSSVGAVGFTGVYLSIGIIVGLSFIHYAVLSRHWIMLIIPMLCLIFYAFVLTSLLSGVISLSIALAIILLRQRVWSAKGIMVASIIIAVFFLSWLLVPVIKERATEQLIRTQSQPTERWASSRVGIFESAFRIFMRHPITGVGLGNVDELIPLYWDLPWVNRRGVHSLYLQMLTEAGIFCLLFFGLIILKCLQKLKDVIIYSKIIPEQFAAIVTIGVLIVILINGLAHTLSRMHYMWVYIGLALSFSDKTRASHKVSYSHSVKERH